MNGLAGPVGEAIPLATGTDDAGPVRCQQNRHHWVRETVQFGASDCESDRNFVSASTTTNLVVKRGCASGA